MILTNRAACAAPRPMTRRDVAGHRTTRKTKTRYLVHPPAGPTHAGVRLEQHLLEVRVAAQHQA